MASGSISVSKIQKFAKGALQAAEDVLASEEPLEIRVNGKAVSVTMRTPGNDEELASGFLFTEGILRNAAEIKAVRPGFNTIDVLLNEGTELNMNKLERNFYTTSSCGVCGKASIDAIKTLSPFESEYAELELQSSVLLSLPASLRASQDVFEKTGGLHASAIFNLQGELLSLREDVGRHNALDKLIGEAFLRSALPLNKVILLLSGRASFELIQKAAMAGIRIIAAVGAPSSLAVETARDFNITLAGFLRDERFNLYSASHRIIA